MNVAIIKRSDGSIVGSYKAEVINQSQFGGDLGDPNQTVHVEIPSGMLPDLCTATKTVDEVSEMRDFWINGVNKIHVSPTDENWIIGPNDALWHNGDDTLSFDPQSVAWEQHQEKVITTLEAWTISATDDQKRQTNKRAKDAYATVRTAAAEDEINAALSGMDATTHLMIAMMLMDQAMNITGDKTQTEIDEAKAALVDYRGLMASVQGMRMARDADIEAFVPPFASVEPLYP